MYSQHIHIIYTLNIYIHVYAFQVTKNDFFLNKKNKKDDQTLLLGFFSIGIYNINCMIISTRLLQLFGDENIVFVYYIITNQQTCKQ